MRNNTIQTLEFIGQHGQMQVARAYNMDVQIYTAGGRITVTKNCFAFMFTNVGDTVAFLNGMVIFPNTTPATALGDSRSIGAHVLDMYKGDMSLVFDAVAPGTDPKVEIVQLFYAESFDRT